MADTLRAFSTRCLSADRVADVQAFAGTRAVVIDLTGEVRASIRHAAPGGTIKGKRGKPVRVGAGYRLDQVRNEGLVFARGPLQLIENDTRAHPEPRVVKDLKRQARTRSQRRTAEGQFVRKGTAGGLLLSPVERGKAMKIPGIGFRRRVAHPGTRGKHPFGGAVDSYRASGKAGQIYARHMRRVLHSVAR